MYGKSVVYRLGMRSLDFKRRNFFSIYECKADSYGNENDQIRFFFKKSHGNENGPDSYSQIRLSVS